MQILYAGVGGLLGCGATPYGDDIAEAASSRRASEEPRAYPLLGTREDDIKGGRAPTDVRSFCFARASTFLVSCWRGRDPLAGQSFLLGTLPEVNLVKNGVDVTVTHRTAATGAGGASGTFRLMGATWCRRRRSCGGRARGQHPQFGRMEPKATIDELADAVKKDGLFISGSLCSRKYLRHVAVLELAAEKADFGKKLPSGKGRGLVSMKSFHTIVVMVVDVSVTGSTVKVDPLGAASCTLWIAVNSYVIKAQIEGGVGYGLGAALSNKITLTDGVVDQANLRKL